MCGSWLKSFVSTILKIESEVLADRTAWNLQVELLRQMNTEYTDATGDAGAVSI